MRRKKNGFTKIVRKKERNLYFNSVTPSVFVQDKKLLSIEALIYSKLN